MYYQNGNYMQDLNYYNQNPNQNLNYNPYMNNNFPAGNMGMNPQMPMQTPQNLNAMYPATYRIISPVVSQVLANQNYGYITEDALNNMVDSVYNIVEGDINLGNHSNTNSQNLENQNTNSSSCERNSSTQRQNTTSNATSNTNAQNTLLRDLIKIMILNEIASRRQNQVMPNNLPNNNMAQSMFM